MSDDKEVEKYCIEGENNFKIGDYDKAIENYTKAIKLNPDFAELYINRGFVYSNKGEYDKTLNDYNKAMELKPDFAEAYYNRGIMYANTSEYDKAIDDYSKAIELKPDYIKAYVKRGKAYNEKGEYDNAIDDCTKAIQINPKYASSYNNRGGNYDEKGEYDNAIDDYTKAIELNPDFAEAYANRGNAYAAKGKYDVSIDDYTKAIELDPQNAIAYYNRGITYNDKNEYNNAITDYTKAIEIKPDFTKAYGNRGASYNNKGEFDKAIDDYTKSIEIDPDYAEAYYNRGIAYANNGEYQKAIEDFVKKIELSLKADEADNKKTFYHRKDKIKISLNYPKESAKLYIHIEGESFNSSLTPSLMKVFIHLQDTIYRQYSLLHYGCIKQLSKEEQKKLEFMVHVAAGSVSISVDLTEALNNLIGKMDSQDVTLTLLSTVAVVGVLWLLKSLGTANINSKKEIALNKIENDARTQLSLKDKEIMLAMSENISQGRIAIHNDLNDDRISSLGINGNIITKEDILRALEVEDNSFHSDLKSTKE